jgi:hypothetical protein
MAGMACSRGPRGSDLPDYEESCRVADRIVERFRKAVLGRDPRALYDLMSRRAKREVAWEEFARDFEERYDGLLREAEGMVVDRVYRPVAGEPYIDLRLRGTGGELMEGWTLVREGRRWKILQSWLRYVDRYTMKR